MIGIRKRILGVAASVLVVLSIAGPASAAETVAVSDIVRPAIVRLRTYWTGNLFVDGQNLNKWFNQGRPYEFSWGCSGFIVGSDGWIATAAHCVEDSASNLEDWRRLLVASALDEAVRLGYYRDDASTRSWAHESWTLGGERAGEPPVRTVVTGLGGSGPGLEDGEMSAARVVEVTTFGEGDVALVKTERSGLPSLQLAEQDIQIGMPVVAVGYPATTEQVSDVSFDPVFQDGKVSGKRTQGYGSYSTYLVSAATSGGMSGGPAVDQQGRVIGLVSFGHRDEPQPFNFLSTAEMLRELLVGRGVSNAPSRIDVAYREGLGALAAGDHDRAIELFEEVSLASPQHPVVRDMLARAMAAKAAAPPAGFPIVGAVAGALSALLGGIVILLLARRRRGEEAATPPGEAPPPGILEVVDLGGDHVAKVG